MVIPPPPEYRPVRSCLVFMLIVFPFLFVLNYLFPIEARAEPHQHVPLPLPESPSTDPMPSLSDYLSAPPSAP